MQLLFGTIGPAPVADPVFEALDAGSRQSTPGLSPARSAGAALRLGHVARSFAAWQSPDGRLRLFLDGQLLRAGANRTAAQGHAPAELAALAELYRRHGADVWAQLDGNYCLIIEDGDAVHIGVDQVSTRTVYWWQAEGVVAFHTHLIDLAAAHPGQLREDQGALGSYLATGTYPLGRSPFHEIQHLPAGHALRVQGGRVECYEHFRMVYTNARAGEPIDRLADELTALLEESVAATAAAASRPGVLLSGGRDSRYLAAAMARAAGPAGARTITYGTARDQANSDGAIARQVAERLGVENLWLVVNHDRHEESFARAIYLSSGADDTAVTYPDHVLMHRELVCEHGVESLLRGDHPFGRGTTLVTSRALIPATDLHHLSLDDPGYRAFLAPELFRQMADGQAAYLRQLVADLRSETLSSRRDEIYYGFRVRQVLASSSKVKNADLEVYNPLLGRRVMEWSRTIPDELRNYKLLFKQVIKRSFPELADVPFATARFQGDWANRIRRDRGLIRFYRAWFDGSGWAERSGAKAQLVRRLDELDAGADTAAVIPPRRSYQDTSGLKFKLRNTWIGQLARELGLERKIANQTPEYLRIGRLAVVHGMFGQIESRRRSARAQAVSTP